MLLDKQFNYFILFSDDISETILFIFIWVSISLVMIQVFAFKLCFTEGTLVSDVWFPRGFWAVAGILYSVDASDISNWFIDNMLSDFNCFDVDGFGDLFCLFIDDWVACPAANDSLSM